MSRPPRIVSQTPSDAQRLARSLEVHQDREQEADVDEDAHGKPGVEEEPEEHQRSDGTQDDHP